MRFVHPYSIARLLRCCVLGACFLTVLNATAALSLGQSSGAPITYQVKIGFLFNFLRFAEWPDATQAGRAPFRLAIASDDSTFTLFANALSGKTANGRPILVERADPLSPEPPPHLLFITDSAPPEARSLSRRYSNAPVLTIGEHDGFARGGGILNFVLVDEAVRFEVNLAAAQRAGLRISSRVSKMAILVRPDL